jgi:hypothetical protein
LSKPHSHELVFIAGLHRLDAANKKAVFYLMNTSRNRNRWGVTQKALDEALPSLLKKPLGMGKDYQLGHFPDEESINVGVFSAFENKGNYALGTVDITDDKVLSMLEAGELGPISSVILPYYDTCSVCGEVLDADWENHPCIAENKAFSEVQSFEFHRFDFVDVPAYPQAGFMNFASKRENGRVPIALLASVYTNSRSPNLQEQNKVSEKEKENEKIAALEQRATKAEADLKKAQDDATANATKVNELSAELKAIKDEKHAGLVEQAYRARIEAGIAGEEKADREMLAALDDKNLKLFTLEAVKIVKVVSTQGHQPPKNKYQAGEEDELAAAVAAKRAELGLPEIKKQEKK